jgi:lipid-A-disaccharide synthase
VEAALLETPLVVVYRVAPLTWWLGRRLVHTPYYSMVNLIAGQPVVPELIQHDFTPERVAREVNRLLTEADAREAMKRELRTVRARLGEPGAIERASRAVLSLLPQLAPASSLS